MSKSAIQTISSIETRQYCPSTKLSLLIAWKLEKPFYDLFFLKERGNENEKSYTRELL